MLETMLDAVSPIRRPGGRPGRPRKRPEKLHADKGYDFARAGRRFASGELSPGSRGVVLSQVSVWGAIAGW